LLLQAFGLSLFEVSSVATIVVVAVGKEVISTVVTLAVLQLRPFLVENQSVGCSPRYPRFALCWLSLSLLLLLLLLLRLLIRHGVLLHHHKYGGWLVLVF
jgi:hypothetical protein